ncbi:response regulator transcription factor [Gracilibacillus timonensis]|uniref:response regulator transcription factor n=1 Tax=Gracilibacillus timonensis TaxID=1816696 RepID=UPI0008260A78|nr:response regulator transcription factor [Gracilibacillus timonensis]
MRKVLIVDDEMQIRKGLQWKVDWKDMGFEVIAEAGNGKEALEVLAKHRLDLVMTDVRMPVMDGIELARHCQERYPQTKVVVLSGYSDFEYVKTSMKKGVRDYLLKPVDPDELEEVLERMKAVIDEDKHKQLELDRVQRQARTQLQEVQEQCLLSLVKEEWVQQSFLQERLKQLKLDVLLDGEWEAQFITVEVREINQQSNRVNQLRGAFQMLCKEMSDHQHGIYAFYDPHYTHMMQFLILLEPAFHNQPSALAKSIQHHVKKLLKLETVVGVGSQVSGLDELKTGYISSLLSWSQSKLGSRSQVIDESVRPEDLTDFSPELEKRIINAIEQTNIARFQSELEMMLGEATPQSVLSFSVAANRVLFCLGSLAKKYGVETKHTQQLIWQCQQAIWELNAQKKVMAYLIQLATVVMEWINDTKSSDGQRIVDGVRSYIDQYYGNDISLTTLSDLFHINAAYLSEIFKTQTGKNFSEYLAEVRLKESKKFLEDHHLKIIDVANLVGFSSSAYFSTVFKKHVGKTPAAYRKSLEWE